jgi:hypothetical protein
MGGPRTKLVGENGQLSKGSSCLSGNDINTRCLGFRSFDFLGGFDLVLIGLDRCNVGVGCFVRDEPDFRLTNDNMGRVCGTYAGHVTSLLELLYFAGIRS